MVEPALDPHDEAVLAELLDLGLAAVRHVQNRLLQASDGKQVADLSLALGRATRSLRQTLALKMKLKREARRIQADERQAAEAAAKARVALRKARLEAVIKPLIWNEYEDDDYELIEKLDERLAQEVFAEDFPDQPLAVQIARLCHDLGIDPPSRDAQAPERTPLFDAAPPPGPSG